MGQLGLFAVTNLLLIRLPREFYKESQLNPDKLNPPRCSVFKIQKQNLQRNFYSMSLVGEREGVINFIRNSHQVILNIVLLAASSLHDQKSGKLTKTETNSLISNASVEQKNAFGSNKIQLPSMSHLLPLGGMLSRTFRIVFNRLYGSFR